MRDYRGDFEVHVTVRAANDAVLGRFRDWCGQRAFKCVHIVLARGAHDQQPMATWLRQSTTLPRVAQEAQQCAADLEHAGIPVVRVKIEVDPGNDEVPVDDVAAHEPCNYFEHHVKLLRATAAPCEALLRTCEKHGAHLSRNAFRQAAHGREERFVTLRCYGVGRTTSLQQLHTLLAALDELGEQVIEHESEYCAYDSNLDLDAGWLSRPS